MTQLLTIGEAAKQLAISPPTLRAWIWHRRIDFVRVGRAVRIKQETVDALVEAGTVRSAKGETK